MSDFNPYDNNNYSNPYQDYQATSSSYLHESVDAKDVMPKTFAIMVVALAITAITSYMLSLNQTFIYNMFIGSGSRLYFVFAMLFEFGAITMTSRFIRKNNMALAFVSFIGYAIINGATLSFIFVAFNITVIAKAFFVSAVVFACMAACGIILDMDLSKVGSIAMMGLIGCIIASLLNIILFRSDSFDILLSIAVIVIFTALTAYDTQKIKKMASNASVTGMSVNTVAVYGAMELYLDFINIFIRLLAILGRKD